MVEEEIHNKVNKAVTQTLDSLNAQCPSGNFISDRVQSYLKSEYMNSYACTTAIKEELKNRVIQVVLKDVSEGE